MNSPATFQEHGTNGVGCTRRRTIESVLATVRRGIVAFVPQVQQKCISKKLTPNPLTTYEIM
jgi:hypothetical protein